MGRMFPKLHDRPCAILTCTSWPLQVPPHPRVHLAADCTTRQIWTLSQISPYARFHTSPDFTLPQISSCPRFHPAPESTISQILLATRLQFLPDCCVVHIQGLLRTQIQTLCRFSHPADSAPAQKMRALADVEFFCSARCREKKSKWTLVYFEWRVAAPELKPIRLQHALSATVWDSFLGPSDQLGVHNLFSSVIKLGIHHPRMKKRKTEILPVFFGVSRTC